jgi:hypothetical protein
MYRGDDLSLLVSVVDASGNPFPLTDAYIYFSVKTGSQATTYTFQRKNTKAGGSSDEIEDTNLAGGQYKVKIVPANTASINPKTYYYDSQVIVGGKTYTVLAGKLNVKSDIT